MQIRSIQDTEKDILNHVVSIHLSTFKGFFLTFMGRGFLRLLYRSFVEYRDSSVLVAFEKETPVGFLAYTGDLSGLYKYMIKKRLVAFAWYSFGAFLRKPTVFMRLVRAFLKPGEAKRQEKYIKLASIGVEPQFTSKGVGSKMIDTLKDAVDFNEYEYIALDADAVDNEGTNYFYRKNGFTVEREFETHEGRKMFEYRYRPEEK